MRKLIAFLTFAAIACAPTTGAAQVYPERVRSSAREAARAAREAARADWYQRGDAREEQTERVARTLKIGATGEISLSNIAGDIVVSRSGGGDATVEIVKTARARTAEEARELLGLVQVDVVERAGRAEIRTRYPQRDDMQRRGRRSFNVSVAYTVTAPEQASITVNSISGDISVRDIKGDLALETISGDVRIANAGRVPRAKTVSGNVEITDTTIEGTMDASTVSGTLHLRNVAARRLDLGSVSGDVRLEAVKCERVGARSVSGQIQLTGPLVRGGRYELGSHSGEVRVLTSGDVGFEVEASSFSGSVRAEMPLTLQGTTVGGRGPRQRSLRGTFGDGSAMLDLSTFSGSIVIAKQ